MGALERGLGKGAEGGLMVFWRFSTWAAGGWERLGREVSRSRSSPARKMAPKVRIHGLESRGLASRPWKKDDDAGVVRNAGADCRPVSQRSWMAWTWPSAGRPD